MKESDKKTILIIAVIVIAAIVLSIVIITSANIKHGGSSDHYDLDCLTETRKDPLEDCKENKI